MSSITLDHIHHSYKNQPTLEDFSFSFTSQRMIALLGPSGCGKTTLLRLIAGLETPQSGRVLIDGKVVTDNKNLIVLPHKRGMGFIFQDLALWPHMSVYENIAFGLHEQGKKQIEQTVKNSLDIFGIADTVHKYPHQLSGGQKQMVAIARTLVLEPKVLLMDEPMANIDVQVKEQILLYLKTLQPLYGFTLLYVTHDHREAFDIGEEIVVMREGKIMAHGTKEEILKTEDTFTKSFVKI